MVELWPRVEQKTEPLAGVPGACSPAPSGQGRRRSHLCADTGRLPGAVRRAPAGGVRCVGQGAGVPLRGRGGRQSALWLHLLLPSARSVTCSVVHTTDLPRACPTAVRSQCTSSNTANEGWSRELCGAKLAHRPPTCCLRLRRGALRGACPRQLCMGAGGGRRGHAAGRAARLRRALRPAHAAGGHVRGLPAAQQQGVLDVRDADLRLLHPEAPLEGTALRRAGPRRSLPANSIRCQAAQGLQQRQPSSNSTACPQGAVPQADMLLRAAAELLQAQVRSRDTDTIQLLMLRSGRAQGGFALHWPLINSDHMRTRLAQRELEAKRLEDARRWRPSPCCSGSWVRDDGPYSVRT